MYMQCIFEKYNLILVSFRLPLVNTIRCLGSAFASAVEKTQHTSPSQNIFFNTKLLQNNDSRMTYYTRVYYNG